MKELLKASIPIIIGTVIGLGIYKLMDLSIIFIYKHFGWIGLYTSTLIFLIIVSTIISYIFRKYIFDKGKSEE